MSEFIEKHWFLILTISVLCVWAIAYFGLYTGTEKNCETKRFRKLILGGPWYWVMKGREQENFIFSRREWVGWGIMLVVIIVAVKYF